MALLIEQVRRLHGHKTRLSIRQRILGRLEDRRACAAAPNPSFRNRAVRQDDRLCASLCRGRRHCAHDGRERERLTRRFAR
jgi:hypothetical protein